MEGKKKNLAMDLISTHGIYLVLILAAYIVFNQSLQLSLLQPVGFVAAASAGHGSVTAAFTPDGDPTTAALAALPAGVPDYGQAIPYKGSSVQISFDDPVSALDLMARFDGGLRGKRFADAELTVKMTAQEQQRYDGLKNDIICRYCCGPVPADSCGCQHAAAKRGLAKFLIRNNPEMSDVTIIEKTREWDLLFFPKQSIDKMLTNYDQTGVIDPAVAMWN